MKTVKLLTICLLLGSAQILFAQGKIQANDESSRLYTIAPMISFSQSSLRGSDISGTQSGYDLGVIMSTPMSSQVSLEAGLLYTKAGAKNDYLLLSTEYDLRYLKVPVGAQYAFGESGWYTRGGAYLAVLTSAERKSQFFLVDEPAQDIKGDTETVDFGAYVGAGYSHDFGSSYKLNIELTYARGFSRVLKNTDAHNEAVGLTVGLPWTL